MRRPFTDPLPLGKDKRRHRLQLNQNGQKHKCGRARGGVGATGISLQLSGRLGPGLDPLLCKLAGYKRAVSKAGGRDGARPLQEWREHLSKALARYIAATALSATGHKAFCAVRDGTTPSERRVKDRDRDRDRKKKKKKRKETEGATEEKKRDRNRKKKQRKDKEKENGETGNIQKGDKGNKGKQGDT